MKRPKRESHSGKAKLKRALGMSSDERAKKGTASMVMMRKRAMEGLSVGEEERWKNWLKTILHNFCKTIIFGNGPRLASYE